MKVFALSHSSSSLHASIHLPASKSISNRALILQAVTGNAIILQNLSTADDTQLMQSVLSSTQSTFHLKNAGTCMRFLTAYFAATPGKDITLLCDERMEQRPIAELVTVLKQLGADITYLKNEGFPPLRIKGKKLSGGNIQMNASASSQFVSALMMIAPLLSESLTIQLEGAISSEPYLKMTAAVMNKFGLVATVTLPKIHLTSHLSHLSSFFSIESDWSSASYWYEMVALSTDAQIHLPGLSLNSLQGDAVIAQHMELFGVRTTESDYGLTLTKGQQSAVGRLTLDLTHSPDLAPALAVTAAACNQNLTLTGLQNLAIKESNRLLALHTELNKLGYHTSITTDSITIHALTSILHPPTSNFQLPTSNFQLPTSNFQLPTSNFQLPTSNDHRLAMAFAPLALIFPSVSIEQPEVVEKSYPHFWIDLLSAGFSIQSFDA